ncbi:MAG: hypothetical protein H6807_14925 [Planctomycetes bacterium]|nr:hypothetical protein [Planctomycetota bacterium]
MAATEVQTVLPQPYEVEQGPGLADYLGIFRRRLGLILVPFVLLTLIAGLVAYVVPPQYTQSTRFKIKDPSMLSGVLAGVSATIPHKPLLTTIVPDIKRQRFLEPIVRKVGLTEGYNLNDPLEQTEFYKRVFTNLEIARNGSDTKPGADTFEFTYTGRSQERNVEFLNELRESYAELFRRDYRNSALGVYEQQKARIQDLRNQLAQLEGAYETFKTSPDYRLVGIRKTHLKEESDLNLKAQDLRIEISNLEAQYDRIEMQLRDQSQTSSVFSQVQNPKKAAERLAIDALKTQLNDLVVNKNWTDLVPAVRDLRAEIEDREAKWKEMPDRVEGVVQLTQNQVYVDLEGKKYDLQREIQGYRNGLQGVMRRLEQVQDELTREFDLSATDTKFQNDIIDLKRRERQADGSYSAIESAWERVKGKGSDLFETLELPNPNTRPVFPSIPLFMAIGAGAGALLGIGLAFLKEFSSMTFLTSGQVQSRLPVPILGEVSEIQTEEERIGERNRKIRNYLIVGLVVLVLGFIHYCYFEASMNAVLPTPLIDLLDKLYGG